LAVERIVAPRAVNVLGKASEPVARACPIAFVPTRTALPAPTTNVPVLAPTAIVWEPVLGTVEARDSVGVML
jgi:hypothetical protein